MTPDNRFKPPEAAVADIAAPGTSRRGASIGLALATLVQAAWAWRPLNASITLTRDGSMAPITLLLVVIGLACLYAGVVRALVAGRQRGRLLATAAVCLVLIFMPAVNSGTFDLRGGFGSYFFFYDAPMLFGLVVAAIGWFVIRQRGVRLA